LLASVLAFDQHLRRGFTDDDLDILRTLLNRLRTNVRAPSPIR